MASEDVATGSRWWLARRSRALYARFSNCITALHGWAMTAVMPAGGRFRTPFALEPDLVMWAPQGPSAAAISARSEAIFQATAEQGVHAATCKHPSALLHKVWPDVEWDRPAVTALRSCPTKREHCDRPARIWAVSDRVTAACCE